jgi:hypothetical protein
MSKVVPQRHWRSYGNDPLPTGAEALGEPFNAFPSWLRQGAADEPGANAAGRHADPRHPRSHAPLGCSGRAGTAELVPASRVPAAGRCGGSHCGRGSGPAAPSGFGNFAIPPRDAAEAAHLSARRERSSLKNVAVQSPRRLVRYERTRPRADATQGEVGRCLRNQSMIGNESGTSQTCRGNIDGQQALKPRCLRWPTVRGSSPLRLADTLPSRRSQTTALQ